MKSSDSGRSEEVRSCLACSSSAKFTHFRVCCSFASSLVNTLFLSSLLLNCFGQLTVRFAEKKKFGSLLLGVTQSLLIGAAG